MDYSSMSEAQQQQYQQQQSDQQQPYDAAQAQAYEAYYTYYGSSAYHHQPYYSNDYSSSTADGYYTTAQPDAAALPAEAAQIHHHHYAPEQEQDGSSYQVPPGMNPAAVAALTQLSQLAGSIDAAERAMERHWHAFGEGMAGQPPPPHYQNYPYPVAMQQGTSSIRPGVGAPIPYRGGGRRGGHRFRGRGGNRGHIGQLPFRRDGGPPSSHGRGHGRIRGRRLHKSALDTQLRQTSTTSEPSISAASQEQGHPKAPQRAFLPVAWCDICRVDCNTSEILEQHKNGKRHKRTVQRIQEIQAQQKVIAEWQYNAASKPDMSFQGLVGHKAANDGELNKTTDLMFAASSHVAEASISVTPSGQETILDEVVKGSVATEESPAPDLITERDMETCILETETGIVGQMLEGQSEAISDSAKNGGPLPGSLEGLSKKRRMVGYDRIDKRRGSNRKMMTGRGGRLFRSFERAHSRPFERPKDRPRDRPRVCTVCNVTCDTLAVFDCHLSGKKHISRMSRFEGQGSVYGPISVYIPPNQPTIHPNNGQEPVFYGLQSHGILQQEAGFRSHGMLQQGDHGLDSHVANHAFQQSSEVELPREEAKDAAPESEVKQDSGNVEVGSVTEGQVAVISEPEGQTTLCDPEARETNASALEAAISMNGNALPIVEDATLPEYGASISKDVVVPGLDAPVEENVANIEEPQ